jgi:hypothetical protein
MWDLCKAKKKFQHGEHGAHGEKQKRLRYYSVLI